MPVEANLQKIWCEGIWKGKKLTIYIIGDIFVIAFRLEGI